MTKAPRPTAMALGNSAHESVRDVRPKPLAAVPAGLSGVRPTDGLVRVTAMCGGLPPTERQRPGTVDRVGDDRILAGPDATAAGPARRTVRRATAAALLYHRMPRRVLATEPSRVKIQEADAKSLLLAQGLPVPGWEVARTAGRGAGGRRPDPGRRRRAGRGQGPGPRRRAGQGRRGQAGRLGGRGGGGRRGDPRPDDQGDPGPQGPRRGGRRHRQGVLPRGDPRPGQSGGSS